MGYATSSPVALATGVRAERAEGQQIASKESAYARGVIVQMNITYARHKPIGLCEIVCHALVHTGFLLVLPSGRVDR